MENTNETKGGFLFDKSNFLWDIDGTLLNFKMSERYAIEYCFNKFHMGTCTDEMLQRYSVINRGYWERLETGELTREQVMLGRFHEFF